MRDHRDDGGGEEHGADGERGDADHMTAQPADGDGPRAVQKKRRQEDDEHERRIDLDRRQSRQEGQRGATGEQGHGRRQAQPMGGIVEGDDRQEHPDHQLEQMRRLHPSGPHR